MKLANLYEQVTTKIIAELETGAAPCTRPWKYQLGRAFGRLSVHVGGRQPLGFSARFAFLKFRSSVTSLPIHDGSVTG